MLSSQDAINRVGEEYPDATITEPVIYNNQYLVKLFFEDSDEGNFDPFYSVDMHTGEVAEFPLFSQPDIPAVLALFPET